MRPALRASLEPLRRSTLLKVCLLIGAAALLGELSLRAWEADQALRERQRVLRSRIEVLAQSTDGIDWVTPTRAVEAARSALTAQLWHAPSEAQAQARLRDWLGAALRSAGAVRPSVSVQPVQAADPARAQVPGSLRVRATLAFDLMPSVLEKALQQIENGGQLARVDTLNVSARSRRVEMAVSVPVLLQDEAALPPSPAPPAARPGGSRR